jgi:hypothetical protein
MFSATAETADITPARAVTGSTSGPASDVAGPHSIQQSKRRVMICLARDGMSSEGGAAKDIGVGYDAASVGKVGNGRRGGGQIILSERRTMFRFQSGSSGPEEDCRLVEVVRLTSFCCCFDMSLDFDSLCSVELELDWGVGFEWSREVVESPIKAPAPAPSLVLLLLLALFKNLFSAVMTCGNHDKISSESVGKCVERSVRSVRSVEWIKFTFPQLFSIIVQDPWIWITNGNLPIWYMINKFAVIGNNWWTDGQMVRCALVTWNHS